MPVRDFALGARIAVKFARKVANAEANSAPVAERRVAAPAEAELPEVRPAGCATARAWAAVGASVLGALFPAEVFCCL